MLVEGSQSHAYKHIITQGLVFAAEKLLYLLLMNLKSIQTVYSHKSQRINEIFLTFPSHDNVEPGGKILLPSWSAAATVQNLLVNILNIKSLNFIHSFNAGLQDLQQVSVSQVFLQIFIDSSHFLPPPHSVWNTNHIKTY